MASFLGGLSAQQVVLLLFAFSNSICTCHEDWRDIGKPIDKSKWIDPYDMGIKIKDVSTESETPTGPDGFTANLKDSNPQIAIPVERTMYRRFVLNFLKKLNLESLPDHTEDSLVHRFAGEIHLHQWEILSLEKLAHSDEGDFIELLHQADLILASMFVGLSPVEQKTWKSIIYEIIELYQESLLYVPNAILLLGVAIVSYQFLAKRSFKSLIVPTMVLSVVWKWVHMVKEKEVEKYGSIMKQGSNKGSCETSKWTIFGSSDKNCLEYHKAALINAFWEVNPLDALSETITLVIVRPLGPIGENLGKFFQRFSSELSWFSYVPIMTILTVMILVGGILFIIVISGYEISLPLFLGHIRPSKTSGGLESTPKHREIPAPRRQLTFKTTDYLRLSHGHRKKAKLKSIKN